MIETTPMAMIRELRKVLKRLHYPLEVMLVCARWYAAYPLSFRHLEEMMQERGVFVDHSTVHRWSLKILLVLALIFRRRKRSVGTSWRLDETYIKVAGQWKYLYRAVDKAGDTVDFLLTAKRDEAAARRYLERAINLHGLPEKITIDKSGANTAAIHSVNMDACLDIELRQCKYLNNIIEQDHRAVKRITDPMMGFKSFWTAQKLISGIETMHMVKKGQLRCPVVKPCLQHSSSIAWHSDFQREPQLCSAGHRYCDRTKNDKGMMTGEPVTYQIPAPAGGVQMETFIPWTLVKRGVRRQVITPIDAPKHFEKEAVVERSAREQVKDSPSIRALGLAHYWQRLLDEGKYRSLTEIASAEGMDRSQVSRIAQLTRLAPKVIQSCLSNDRCPPKFDELARVCLAGSWAGQPAILESGSQDPSRP